MEIKVGIQHIGREVTVDSQSTAEAVQSELEKALADDSLLALQDTKGRRVLIPAARIAYVEIGEENARRVGFGSV